MVRQKCSGIRRSYLERRSPGRSWKHLHLELDWTRSRTKRAVTRRTEKLAKCVTHSHLAFLKRMNRRRQNTAITPSTTK